MTATRVGEAATAAPDAEELARLLQAARPRRRNALDECRADVASALALVEAPGRHFVTAVRIAGVRMARP